MAHRTVNCTNEDLQNIFAKIGEFREKTEKISIPAKISYIIYRNEQSLLDPYFSFRRDLEENVKKHLEFDDNGRYKQITKFDDDGNETSKEPIFKTSKEEFEKDYKTISSTNVQLKFYVPHNVEEKLEDFTAEGEILQLLFNLLEIFENWAK